MSNPSYHGGIFSRDDASAIMLAELNNRVEDEITAALAELRIVQRRLWEACEPTGALDQAVCRLEHFGKIHNILDGGRFNRTLTDRLEALCRAVSVAKAAPRGIRIEFAADDVSVADEVASTVCAVVSELLANILAHAFDEDVGGLVVVELRNRGGSIAVTVADNGQGNCAAKGSAHLSGLPASGAGWAVVTELAERMGGTIDCHGAFSGTTVSMVILTGKSEITKIYT